MSEVLFYHLEARVLDDVLPGLLERTRERGQKVIIRAGSAERVEAIDTHLWTYSDQNFLAHGTAADGYVTRHPIFLTTEEENPNGAQVLFLIGGAVPSDWGLPNIKAFTRIVLMFDGRDGEALEIARAAWRDARANGHDATYWKEMPSGKFEKQA